VNYEINKTQKPDLNSPIPINILEMDSSYLDIPIVENNEPLVPIGAFSGNNYDRIFTSSIYFGEHADSPYPYGHERLKGSLITTFAREGAADQLLKVEEMLPERHHIILLDTFRTTDVQASLFNQYFQPLKNQHPDWTEEQLETETKKYVSKPSTDPHKPSTHNTGGSIDLAIYTLPEEIENSIEVINSRIALIGFDVTNWKEVYDLEMKRISLISKNAELLEFGSAFDWGGRESALNYYEKLELERPLSSKEEEAQKNRRMLYNTMVLAGFEPFDSEWWHFNSKKTQMGAKTAGLGHAEYGPAILSKENEEYERMREQHLSGHQYLSSIKPSDKLGMSISALGVASLSARKIGDLRITSLPKADLIAPPEEKVA
jgi:zinc D-Ala-D-Ala dipeptidase